MKVGGGLNYVTGPMGAGKTFYGVRRICDYVTTGRYVVTNVRLHDDAFERIAKHTAPWRSSAARRELAERMKGFYVYEDDLEAAMRYRLPGKGEGRGAFLWDEGQHGLNNRSWKDEGRAEVLSWATQLRKLGFVGYLLTQHQDNTDAALRRVCNFRVVLQNQREQTRLLGMRVTPWPLFLAGSMPTNVPIGRKQTPAKIERYMLGWQRNLYDTHGLSHGLVQAMDPDSVMLPGGGRRAPPPQAEAVRR